jgi:hypothetical protein
MFVSMAFNLRNLPFTVSPIAPLSVFPRFCSQTFSLSSLPISTSFFKTSYAISRRYSMMARGSSFCAAMSVSCEVIRLCKGFPRSRPSNCQQSHFGIGGVKGLEFSIYTCKRSPVDVDWPGTYLNAGLQRREENDAISPLPTPKYC